MLHTDGQSPSEFASNSTYIGMHTDCSRYTGSSNTGTTDNGGSSATTTDEKMKETEIKSFGDLMDKATTAEEFFLLVWYNPWAIFVWFHFW